MVRGGYNRKKKNEISLFVCCRRAGGGASTAWDNNFWLGVDYLPVAQAAHHSGEYFTCLLFTEIWCYKQKYVIIAINTTLEMY